MTRARSERLGCVGEMLENVVEDDDIERFRIRQTIRKESYADAEPLLQSASRHRLIGFDTDRLQSGSLGFCEKKPGTAANFEQGVTPSSDVFPDVVKHGPKILLPDIIQVTDGVVFVLRIEKKRILFEQVRHWP